MMHVYFKLDQQVLNCMNIGLINMNKGDFQELHHPWQWMNYWEEPDKFSNVIRCVYIKKW
jgi:hypothetical protein